MVVAGSDDDRTGVPADLVPGDHNHTISDLTVSIPDKTDSDDDLRMIIDLNALNTSSVDTADAYIETFSSENAVLLNQEKHTLSDGSESVQFVVRITEADRSVHIDELTIGGLETGQAQQSSDLAYRIAVSPDDSNPVDDPYINESDVVNSELFNIAGGSLRVQDQATASSTLTSSGSTRLSITAENVQANVDGTLVVVFEDGDKELIVGREDVSANQLDGNNEIAITYDETGGFPGPHTVYLIPQDRVDGGEYDSNTELPESARSTAIATGTAASFVGVVSFEDREYESVVMDNITVSDAYLFDEGFSEVPYVITVHPLNRDGIAHTDRFVGSSSVLSGHVSDIKIDLETGDGRSSLSRTNKYAAIVRTVDPEYATESRAPLINTSLIPNSDADRKFVESGVADVGTVLINRTEESDEPPDRTFDSSSEYQNQLIYAGETVDFGYTAEESETVSLYREADSNSELLTSVHSIEAGSGIIEISTSGLASGEYFFAGADFEPKSTFEIVGIGDQYAHIDIDNAAVLGDVIDFTVESAANTTVLTITDPDGEHVATADLTAPDGDPVDVAMNTYVAGDPEHDADFLTVEGATIDALSTTERDGPLPAGEYTLTARAAPNGPAHAVTTTLEPRSTDDLTVYTNATAELDPADLRTSQAVADALAAGTLTPATTVNATDTLVYGLDASGLGGYLATRDPRPTTGTELDALPGLAFAVTTDPADGEPVTRTTASGTDLLTHDDGLFLVGTANDTLASTDDDADDTPEEEALLATAEVLDDRLRAAAADAPTGDDPHTAAASMTYRSPISSSTEETEETEQTEQTEQTQETSTAENETDEHDMKEGDSTDDSGSEEAEEAADTGSDDGSESDAEGGTDTEADGPDEPDGDGADPDTTEETDEADDTVDPGTDEEPTDETDWETEDGSAETDGSDDTEPIDADDGDTPDDLDGGESDDAAADGTTPDSTDDERALDDIDDGDTTDGTDGMDGTDGEMTDGEMTDEQMTDGERTDERMTDGERTDEQMTDGEMTGDSTTDDTTSTGTGTDSAGTTADGEALPESETPTDSDETATSLGSTASTDDTGDDPAEPVSDEGSSGGEPSSNTPVSDDTNSGDGDTPGGGSTPPDGVDPTVDGDPTDSVGPADSVGSTESVDPTDSADASSAADDLDGVPTPDSRPDPGGFGPRAVADLADAQAISGPTHGSPGRVASDGPDPTETAATEAAAGPIGTDTAEARPHDAAVEESPAPTAVRDVDGHHGRPPGIEEAPLRSTADDVPGFWVAAALLALVFAVGVGLRRSRR